MKSPPCALLLFVGFGIPLALFVSIAVRVDIAFDVVVVRGVVVDVDVVVFLVADVVFLESCWRPRPLACCTLCFYCWYLKKYFWEKCFVVNIV